MVELEFLECWFLWRVENRRTTLGASWEPTKQTQPTYGTKPELNPRYIGGRRALPPLHHPWFPAPQQKDVLCYHLVNSPSLVTSSMLFFLTGLLVRWRFSWLLRNQNKRYHYAQSEETEKSPDDAKCRKTCANDCERVLPVLRCKTLELRQTVPFLLGLFPLQLLYILPYHQAPGTTSLSWNSLMNQ